MALRVKRMTDQALAGKRVLIREDLNVPVKDGKVTSTARLDAALPTLRAALDAKARVLVMSHLGRPKEGKPEPGASLAPVAAKLGELLGRKVPLAANWLGGIDVNATMPFMKQQELANYGQDLLRCRFLPDGTLLTGDDRGRVKQLASSAQQRIADSFTPEAMAQRTLSIYRRLKSAGPLRTAA